MPGKVFDPESMLEVDSEPLPFFMGLYLLLLLVAGIVTLVTRECFFCHRLRPRWKVCRFEKTEALRALWECWDRADCALHREVRP